MTTDKPNVLYTASGDEVIIASRRPYWFWAKHLAISIIGTATLLPIIAYLGQTYLENQLNASNERLKTDLSRE